MPKKDVKRSRRLKNLIGVGALSTIVLIVATFAWFIGMQTVNVASFDVEIATVDGLMLSLDGKKWDTTVTLSKGSLGTVSYVGHTNNWAGRGLIPMSTIGEMDIDASRMKIYEKASITASPDGSPGGYRLMASRIPNYTGTEPERDGYVVFDLFVRNSTGTKYIDGLNLKDEEAIYLTTDSSATVAAVVNGGVEDTGIENSVRVAFAQIGRVSGFTNDPDVITGITCNKQQADGLPGVSDGVTGICRTAQIWEPNDKDHVANAISWYDTSCLARLATGTDVMAAASYSGSCATLTDGTAYPTYAVKEAINSEDNVNIYDGLAYNTYTKSTKLNAYPYFTDTKKELRGTSRPAFMTLAPNSITKVRVYVYIEGQDVDNYDFASIGRKVSVKFGFTKQRFIEGDIGYGVDDPTLVPGTDTAKPTITLLGDAAVEHTKGIAYVDAGATAADLVDGDITDKIQTINAVDITKVGVYYVSYDVCDWAGNHADRIYRTVTVKE